MRQDSDLVAVGAGSGVSVETHGVAARSRVGRTIINNRIAGIRGAGSCVVVGPAYWQVVGCHSGGSATRIGVKVLHERQCSDYVT